MIPDDGSVEILGRSCFKYAGLQEIDLPEGIVEVESNAFWENDLQSLHLPSTLNSVADLAFCYVGEELSSIEMAGDGKGEIYAKGNCLIRRSDSRLLLGCRNSIIPDEVLELGPACLEKRGIEEIQFPASIIRSYDFTLSQNYNLKYFVLPESMSEIGLHFFNECTSLERVVIPKSVTAIRKGAFLECSSLETICYLGTEEEWNRILIEESNDVINDAEIIFEYSDKEFGGAGQ